MQEITSAAPSRVILQGEWTMNEATERLEFLTGELATQLEGDPKPCRSLIDLAGVTELDACGCQLLVLFLENLRRHGINPEPCCIPTELGDTICLLGFADTLADSEIPKKESR